jgi:hypothetical protein
VVVDGGEGISDLGLGGLEINNEDQSVFVFDLLHGLFSIQRVLDDGVFIEALLNGEESLSMSSIFALSAEFKSLGLEESGGSVNFVLSGVFSLLVGLGNLGSDLGGLGLVLSLCFLLAHCSFRFYLIMLLLNARE